MDLSKRYVDSDENECSILQMVEREPEWSANRIQEGEKAIAELRQVKIQLERLQEMERNYSHQLGEMARLCDVVCGEVLSFNTTGLFPYNVTSAADEIMQYVDAVRPTDGPAVEWAVHVIGPDDIIPCEGEFDALRKANQHNKSFAKMMADDHSPNDPYCVALAVLV